MKEVSGRAKKYQVDKDWKTLKAFVSKSYLGDAATVTTTSEDGYDVAGYLVVKNANGKTLRKKPMSVAINHALFDDWCQDRFAIGDMYEYLLSTVDLTNELVFAAPRVYTDSSDE